jgi:DNA replication protein DnaC
MTETSEVCEPHGWPHIKTARRNHAGPTAAFFGPPGVGKTHLAISLAIAAAESGRRVYYGTLVGLIESLEAARAAGQLARRLRVLSHPALLIVDEIGYLPVSRDGAVLFFQLINYRDEHASTVLTSNKGFEEWGAILGDPVIADAIRDRLEHAALTITITGESYRGVKARKLAAKKKDA